MSPSILAKNSLEILEARIAPAAVLPTNPNSYVKATLGGPVELFAGQVLTTGAYNSGSYLMYVEEGSALVFFTDLNNNKNADFNEITGIAASDGLRLICYADVHGDIATNMIPQSGSFPQPDGTVKRTVLVLSDSDSNPANDPLQTRGDGRVLLNNTIEKIEFRSLLAEEIPDQNGDGAVDDDDVGLRKVESTYSLFGNIYAGKGFGASDGGLIIDSTGLQNFGLETSTRSQIGAIRTGTAASGKFFSFGASREDNISGTFLNFIPPKGQVGGDIIGLRPGASTAFNVAGFYAGDGGVGARGGDVSDIIITGDDTGGYDVIAGNGGRGPNGGTGGSIFNFSDLGSNTSKITIRSGNGGAGATGTGGDGGDFRFNTFNARGNVSMILGSGGDGFTRGGDGTSLSSGTFSQTFPVDVIGGNGFGTTHFQDASSGIYTARIGTHQAVDFDLDGFGDFVFTTKEPLSQLVVMFGDGDPFLPGFRTILGPDGLFVPDRYYLDAARNAEALVVADLNADGHPDIATGSLDKGSHAGVSVFLSQFEDVNRDGVLTSTEDLNGNGRNDFTGFSDARYSVLPQLERGDPDTTNAIFPYWESPHQIGAITAGDYDGDGRPELAVVVTQYGIKGDDGDTGATTSLTLPSQVLLFLQPDQEFNNLSGKVEYTGQFFADFGTKRIETPAGVVVAKPLAPFFDMNGGLAETNVVESTALTTTAIDPLLQHDVVIYGFIGGTDVSPTPKIHTIDYSDRAPIPTLGPIQIAPEPLLTGTWTMGRIDNNRDLNDPGQQNKQNFEYLEFRDLTAVDLDADGNADLGVIGGGATQGFVIGIKGTGTGGGATVSGNAVDNAGNFIGPRGYNVGSTAALAIKSADTDGDGLIDDLAVWTGFGDAALLVFQPGILPPDPNGGPGQTTGAKFTRLVTPSPRLDSGPVLFDLQFARVKDLAAPSYAALDLRDYTPIHDFIYFQGLLTKAGAVPPKPALTTRAFEKIDEFGFGLIAGNGGNALVGRGGLGGSLGAPGSLGTLTIDAIGRVRLFAGDGGNGFSLGGDGGYVAGVIVRGSVFTVDNPDGSTTTTAFGVGTSLVGGDGGRGVAGRGGIGGFLSDNSIQGGSVFNAGNGGDGLAGGNGGFVKGNGTGAYDSNSSGLRIASGNGGSGTRRAGNGGDITNFDPFVNAGTDSGSLSYTAGDGGDSVSGPGGLGGSIISSSPRANAQLELDIYLESGDGGTGRIGGNAGIIRDFVISTAAQAKKPALLSFIGGEGGYGLVGVGGAGGSLIDIDVQSRGVAVGFPLFANFDFNRALAGNGGGSANGAGGTGGGIRGFMSGADQGSYAIVAGAGGDGLTAGGLGGSVKTLNLATGASTLSKVLVIAGQGGSAAAFIPNKEDSSANQKDNQFGGRVGRAGNGGSIIGVIQTGQTGAHFDFIAGNGGDTINYGTVLDSPAPYVGKGGSVQNVQLTGDIGNVDLGQVNPNTGVVDPSTIVAIKSYNDLLGSGQTVRQYADQKFRTEPLIGLTSFSDADGNVGIVVGAAGRNKLVSLDPTGNPGGYTSQPAQRGVNGSLTDIGARNILAAVAGSTDRIASIQVVKNIQVVNGIVGSDKPKPDASGAFGVPLVFGTFDYLDRNGIIIPSGPQGESPGPVLDGRLFDGAIVGKTFLDGVGAVVTPSGRSYRRS